MIFETHAHYDDKAFDEDRFDIMDLLQAENIGRVIDPGCDVLSTERAMHLAEQYPFLYFAAGIHPEELPVDPNADLMRIAELAAHKKCVAIGEIGLDYHWDDTHKPEQKQLFHAQMKLAQELSKPVIIHDRDAHGDTMEIVRQYPEVQGVLHCYSGSAEMAKELLKLGWYLGFDGPVTYKNARKTLEVLEICPADRILIETDSPYMSPAPVRGTRNDSRNLKYVLEKIAEVRGISTEEAETLTWNNAHVLFGI